jgi:hypothetical protein
MKDMGDWFSLIVVHQRLPAAGWPEHLDPMPRR